MTISLKKGGGDIINDIPLPIYVVSSYIKV